MSAIEVEALTKRFGDFTAVDRISFDVRPGEIFGLLGPNGAGKSTLIRMLTTLIPPTAGAARVAGFDIASQADGVRRAIGVIPQAMTSDLELSVEENLLIFAKLYGVPRDRRVRIMKELLEAVELTAWADKPVKNLSGGMRRRVEIARGLVHEPKVFFLDEPTTGLDPVSRVAVWEMLQRVKARHELTVLLTTHYMDEADRLCDRVAIVDHGQMKALDHPMMLKTSIPGRNVLEVAFDSVPEGWQARLEALPQVERVVAQDSIFRIVSNNGPATTTALLAAAPAANVEVRSLSVQSTTLDDVFVHYTGRQLRDALQEGVTGDVAGVKESPVYAILEMRKKIDAIQLPEGYGITQHTASLPSSDRRFAMKWDGEWHITYEVFRDLGLAFGVVLILIFVLVVGWFQSFSTPMVIMVAIPFSLIGILPAHWAMGAFFTATSMIGFIAGAGIVVRNSIILVDFIELRLREGMPLDKAVVDAGAVRFRPMMLTAAAVVVGASVILFDPIFQGLAISLMAGEVASLLFSRMTVPILYFLDKRWESGHGVDIAHQRTRTQ